MREKGNTMETLTSIQMSCQHLLDKPRVYADLNAGWKKGAEYIVPLNSRATESDLRQLGYFPLSPDLALDFWADDGDDEGRPDPLLFRGVTRFDEDTQGWVAVTGWNDFRHASEMKAAQAQEPALA